MADENNRKQNLDESEKRDDTDSEGKGTKNEHFSFLNEEVKPRTLSGRQVAARFAAFAAAGVVLGVCVCIGFYAVRPMAENWFGEKAETVTIPDDETADGTDAGSETTADGEASDSTEDETTAGGTDAGSESSADGTDAGSGTSSDSADAADSEASGAAGSAADAGGAGTEDGAESDSGSGTSGSETDVGGTGTSDGAESGSGENASDSTDSEASDTAGTGDGEESDSGSDTSGSGTDTGEDEDEPLNSDDYEELFDSLYEIAESCETSVVTVSVPSEDDAQAETQSTDSAAAGEDTVSGFIAADNGKQVLIFASDAVCESADVWNVTFCDGEIYEAELVKRDKNSGFAVFGVEKDSLSESTEENTAVAELGSSYAGARGDVVIAVGCMFGYKDAVGYGIISAAHDKETIYDGNLDVLATDIAAAENGTGILFNTKGQVIGIIDPRIWADTGGTTANAYGISDLKTIIEFLANGESVPYVGIYGTTVTEELQAEGMPAGVYVSEVSSDSPAMEAGIQSGDIITQVGGENVSGLASFQNILMEASAGEKITLVGQRQGADGYVEVEFTVTAGSSE